ncbi:MAG: cob(I)yrinic acid a,c-diamide adenosyltransferase [Pseudoflavonifractor sp.]|nr:cob(I)yrinic acid a,c-diamide adenosyltransferase [Pseudoflavonifractor sp.]
MGKIYTKTGDNGITMLYGGTKVQKSSDRVAAYGAVDEANAAIGLAAATLHQQVLVDLLRCCQQKLIVMGSELASDERGRRNLAAHITAEDTGFLEQAIDELVDSLPQNTQFILPGLSMDSAVLHVARTAVRRAERCIVGVKEAAKIGSDILVYMNRLSDLLFVMSRAVDEVDAFCQDVN